jgi:hypothetical protein
VRVIEISERQVLPDQDAEFVAEIEKIGRGIERRARHAQHVHAGLAGQREQRPHPARAEADEIRRSPEGAAAEDRDAVDGERQARFEGPRQRQRPEAHTAEIDRNAVDPGGDRVEVRRTMGVRPPGGDSRQHHLTGEEARFRLGEHRLAPVAAERDRPGAALDGQARGQAAGRPVEGGAQVGRTAGAHRLKGDRPVGADMVDFRSPARHESERAGPHMAQGARRDHPRPPAPALGRPVEFRPQRAEAEREIGFVAEPDLHRVRREHRAGGEHRHAVEPDLGERRQALEAQADPGGAGEPRPIPDVPIVDRRRRRLRPASGRAQGSGGGPRNHGRDPIGHPVEIARPRAGAGRRQGEPPGTGQVLGRLSIDAPDQGHRATRRSRVSKGTRPFGGVSG